MIVYNVDVMDEITNMAAFRCCERLGGYVFYNTLRNSSGTIEKLDGDVKNRSLQIGDRFTTKGLNYATILFSSINQHSRRAE